MRTLLFAGLFTIAMSTVIDISTLAQSGVLPKNNTPVPQQRTNYIKQHVSDITSDEESKILGIEEGCSAAMQTANNDRAKDSVSRSTDSEIKEVLTPDQYTQYEKIKKNLPKESAGSY